MSISSSVSSSSGTGGGPSASGSHGLGGTYTMFPMVEKYRVRVTEDIERDLRFLGQSRVDALTSEFAMNLVKEKPGLKLYELAENEFFTMKGVTTCSAPLAEVMNMLRMDTTVKLRDAMGEIFGPLFLDGSVLYKAKESPARMNESLTVNWMALQASKPHLPHRDYVFLRYGDVYEKNAEHGSVYGANGSGLYVGATIWESIELDGCAPLPASQNVVRLRFRRCGFVVEELNHEDGIKISFFLSEAHPGRAAVSSLTKQWMSKMVACVAEIGNVMVTKALASQNILTKKQFIKDGVSCFICVKAFSLLRRKHHCRVCGDVVCSKCSEIKNIKQGGVNKEIRVCQQCRNSSSASLRSSGSESRTMRSGQNGSSKPSFSNYSVSSSEASNSIYEDDMSGTVSIASTPSQPMIPEHLPHGLSETSEPSQIKTHPSQLVRHGSRNDMIMLNNGTKTLAGGNDMILLNSRQRAAKDRAESSNSTVSDSSYSEFGMYAQPIASLSEDEMAAMELASTVRENTPFTYALSYSSRQDWPKAPMPQNETERLRKVRELHLVDPGQHFQEMCEYAAAEMGCQIASICFIGDKSGFLMSKVGVDKRELPRNMLFDAHTIMSEEPMIILDASEDVRFVNNPLVVEGKVRFYAGFPMITADGHIVGSFSVADPFARECLNGDKYFFLKNLAEVAMRGVEQNTFGGGQQVVAATVPGGEPVALGVQVPPSPDMNIVDAHMTMQELLRTAYTTQCQVRMQVNPIGNK